MSALERRYRRLFRAYPTEHRRRREDEMVGALLDASDPGQCWPAPREAVAIVSNGWQVRARTATEWTRGLAVASIGASAAASMIATVVLGVAVVSALHPSDVPDHHPWVKVGAWLLAAVALVVIAVARRATVSLAAAAALTAATVAGGADLIGVRRSVAIPFVTLAIIAAGGRAVQTGRPRSRVLTLLAGAVAGTWLFLSEGADVWLTGTNVYGWHFIDRWAYLPWRLVLPFWAWLGLVGVAALAGAVRPRFAIAGALLCTPLLPLTGRVFGTSWLHTATFQLAAALTLLVAVAAIRMALVSRPDPEPSSPALGR